MTKKNLLSLNPTKPKRIQFIAFIYFCLFAVTPLLFFTQTSELFEFNKMIFVYLLTLLIVVTWVAESIFTKRLPFKRTVLDIPLALFVSTQALSTLFSIDSRISFLGYYSRWNGGLLSIISYAVLYWAAVTFLDKGMLKKLITALFVSTVVASLWGVLEHFGHSVSCLVITGNFDVSCWVQEVALRVYATFGQPNWMAAWLTAVIPLSWSILLVRRDTTRPIFKDKGLLVLAAISLLTFVALLFTKSRSGVVGFGVAFVLFWLGSVVSTVVRKKIMRVGLAITLSLGCAVALVGTPWTPSISSLTNQNLTPKATEAPVGPALETGGTESGEIRRIVWEGAVNVWKKYPLLGSGVETFALSYYQGRPMAHNHTSEWNFLYNKAHNEYLNYLATTGVVGLVSYLVFIATALYFFFSKVFVLKNQETDNNKPILLALTAGFVSILITNFFGFSVVTTNLLFFLFPALGIVSQSTHREEQTETSKKDSWQWVGLGALAVVGLVSFYFLFTYWTADTYYAAATKDKAAQDYTLAVSHINSAIAQANEPIYYDFRADLYATLATVSDNSKETNLTKTLIVRTLHDLETVKAASPMNVKLLKSRANILADITDLDTTKMPLLIDSLNTLSKLAPTDPSVYYQRGLAFAKQSDLDKAVKDVELSVSMKPNYKIARRLLAFLYKEVGQKEKARQQLEYILKKISPDDTTIQEELKAL